MENDWMTLREAKEWLRVGDWTIRQAIQLGELPASEVNKRRDLRIRRSDLVDWMRSRNIGAKQPEEAIATE